MISRLLEKFNNGYLDLYFVDEKFQTPSNCGNLLTFAQSEKKFSGICTFLSELSQSSVPLDIYSFDF